MDISNIKLIFTNKVAIITVLLTVLWISTDVSQRLVNEPKQNSRSSNVLDVKAFFLPNVPMQTAAQIKQAYKKYRTEVASVPAPLSGMTAAEQSQQTGELPALFVGEHKLVLKAIVHNEQQRSALMQITNIKDKSLRVEKFNDLGDVYGFQLQVINNTQVQLSKQNVNERQLITLTMYKLEQKKT
jgi:hypothetical protein